MRRVELVCRLRYAYVLDSVGEIVFAQIGSVIV